MAVAANACATANPAGRGLPTSLIAISEALGATYPSGIVPVDLTGWPGSTVTLTLNGVSQGTFTFDSTGALYLTAQGTAGAALPADEYTVDAQYADASGTSTGITTTPFAVSP